MANKSLGGLGLNGKRYHT